MLHMVDQSVDEYFSKIKSLITLLSDLRSGVSEDDVVTYAINGLCHKYGSLAQIIAHKDPFPDLATMRSLVSIEELRLRSKSPIQPTNMIASAPQVLLATSNIPRGCNNRNTRDRDNRKLNTSTEVCRNFGRGFCRWGDSCRFVHDSNRDTCNTRTPSNSSQNIRTNQWGQGVRSMKNGVGSGGLNVHASNSCPRSSAPPGFTSTQHQQAQHAFSLRQQALNTMTLQEPADLNWNMNTTATSHLNSSTSNLSTIFNSCMYPSVLVGDGKSIPVTNTGQITLRTPHRTPHLNNVLITPNIVKNLISVRQFVRENKCTIEFDEFGFSVKDFWTRQIRLRCDSTGDLYPVTSLSYPKAFLLGKHVRLPFSPSETIVTSPFDIIHSVVDFSTFECLGH
nr:ribonuclease H-like domain-containing protein [Tanacetum cinerariifolium]